MKKRIMTGLFCCIGFLILILDTKTAISGMIEGMELCIQVLIPSLFPFFVISTMLTDTVLSINSSTLRRIGKIFRIPKGAEPLLLIGLLGGYPVGAQTIVQAHRKYSLDSEDARRMLGFCSNAGPSFIFGMVAYQFSDISVGWKLWFIQILASWIVGIYLPKRTQKPLQITSHSQISLPKAMELSIRNMASVCGWVVCFRVIIHFLDRWFLWILPVDMQTFSSLLLELSNGCVLLKNVTNEGIRFMMASFALSFGGICVTMQTLSVTKELGLGMYLPGKLLQAVISIAISGILWYRPLFLLPAIFLILLPAIFFSYKTKKIVEIPNQSVYNEKKSKENSLCCFVKK